MTPTNRVSQTTSSPGQHGNMQVLIYRNQLTAGRAGTSVTGLLGLLVTTLAEVISTGVDDESALSNSG